MKAEHWHDKADGSKVIHSHEGGDRPHHHEGPQRPRGTIVMKTDMGRIGGGLLLVGVIIFGYVIVKSSNQPDPSTCRFINRTQANLGGPATCHVWSPPAGLLWAAGALVVVGILLLVAQVRDRRADP
jgi:hypothetical protein